MIQVKSRLDALLNTVGKSLSLRRKLLNLFVDNEKLGIETYFDTDTDMFFSIKTHKPFNDKK